MLDKIKHILMKAKEPDTNKTNIGDSEFSNYFSLAKSWADDIYTAVIVSRNRYKAAFYWAASMASLLVVTLIMLLPLQHTALVVVHHYNDGTVWVRAEKQKYAPINKALVESELVRYVINRESYSPSSYGEQYSLINMLSSGKVAGEYRDAQSANNKNSPINVLRNHGTMKVHVENVIFLDNKEFQDKKDQEKHSNLAQVNFRVTIYNGISGHGTTIPYAALVSWEHLGVATDPETMWSNWDGFNATRYDVEQRNIN